jgi:hypothetical protein
LSGHWFFDLLVVWTDDPYPASQNPVLVTECRFDSGRPHHFSKFFDRVGVSRPAAVPREPAAIASISITQMGLVHFAAAND